MYVGIEVRSRFWKDVDNCSWKVSEEGVLRYFYLFLSLLWKFYNHCLRLNRIYTSVAHLLSASYCSINHFWNFCNRTLRQETSVKRWLVRHSESVKIAITSIPLHKCSQVEPYSPYVETWVKDTVVHRGTGNGRTFTFPPGGVQVQRLPPGPWVPFLSTSPSWPPS